MRTSRSGFTVVEMLVAMTFFAILAAMAITPMRHSLVREAVRGARLATATHVARARGAASSRGCLAVLHLDGGSNRLWVTACPINQPNGTDTVGTVDDMMMRYHVELSTNKDSVVFAPTGLMMSASLLSVQLGRAGQKDSLAVSPTGRLLW